MARGVIRSRTGKNRRLTSKFLDYRQVLKQSYTPLNMKTENQIVVRARKSVWTLPLKTALIGLLVLSSTAETQQVIMSQPQSSTSSTTQPIWQQSQTNEFQVFSPEEEPGSAPQQSQPFQYGPLIAKPHVTYQFLYVSGVQSSPSNHQDTVIHEFSPGILLDIGTHWALDYTPTLTYYENNHFKNEFDNSITLTGGTAYEDWLFGLSQSYSSSSSPQAETGTQTDQENYSTALTASYAFNSKFSLDMSVNQNFSFVDNNFGTTNSADNSQSTRGWSTMEWLNYTFSPRLNAGVGAGIGYVNVNIAPDQTYEQLQGRVNWRATDKVSFQVNAGFQDVQFYTPGAGDLLNPTFGASIQYQPFKQTQISANASQTTSANTFSFQGSDAGFTQGGATESTSVSCNLNQRLLEKLYLNLGVGYTTTKYTDSISGFGGALSGNRVDDYSYFSANLSRSFLKRGTMSVTYQYSDNSSSLPGFSFSSSQIGFEIGYTY
jgi:hypothetical protein